MRFGYGLLNDKPSRTFYSVQIVLKVWTAASILDNLNEKINTTPPSPISVMVKAARFGFSASSTFFRGVVLFLLILFQFTSSVIVTLLCVSYV